MEQMQNIKDLLQPILNEFGLNLFKISWTKIEHLRALEVLIYDKEKPMSLDDIAKVSEKLSEVLDEANLFDFEYMLDIGSAGAEREFLLSEANEYLEKYVYAKFKNPVMGGDSVFGYLRSVSDTHIVIEYQVKQAKKKIELEKENIASIRLAVKV